MAPYRGWRAAIVSYRLGTADGVSVAAGQWTRALRRLGMTVRTVAGEGSADVLLDELALSTRRAPSRVALDRVLHDVDLVVVDNACSLPMNRRVGDALASYLAGRRAILRHHDLPWERAEYANVWDWPPEDPAWLHVTINDVAKRALAARGIAATTVHHGFELPGPNDSGRGTARLRQRIGAGVDDLVVLQPTRAIPRKNIPAGMALAHALGGRYWLTGPAEDGFADQLRALLRASAGPVHRGLPSGATMADAYRACDVVVLPSTWEGFGLPLIEAALHRRPIAVGDFPVAREVAAYGFRWFDVHDPAALSRWLADPGPSLLDHNQRIARKHFSLSALASRLADLLSGWDWYPGTAPDRIADDGVARGREPDEVA
jgi:glycosyltransferase involved in cell wall biosynthesis